MNEKYDIILKHIREVTSQTLYSNKYEYNPEDIVEFDFYEDIPILMKC